MATAAVTTTVATGIRLVATTIATAFPIATTATPMAMAFPTATRVAISRATSPGRLRYANGRASPTCEARRPFRRKSVAARPQLDSYPLQWEGPGNKGSLGGKNDGQGKMARRGRAGGVHSGLRGDDEL